MEDVSFQIIDRVFGESRYREGFWQFKLDSFAPEGLNVRLLTSLLECPPISLSRIQFTLLKWPLSTLSHSIVSFFTALALP